MIKFETINGTLCRMVGPEPLTDKAQFPCVVRLIQDNTMLGKANKSLIECYPETHANKRICNKLTDDGLYMDGYYTYRYEIIGYPVADGSLEWALYQIRSGKKVVKEGGGERYVGSFYKNRLFYLNDYDYLVTKNAIGLIDPCSEEEFLDLDKTGWQLYEPQPEPEPAFKAGDWVEYRLDSRIYYGEINDIRDHAYYLSFTTEDIPPDQARAIRLENIARKLNPSEVVLNFGSGIKGTVRSCEHDGGCVRVISGDRVIAHIMTDVLEQPTRNLVRQLLKAQGGEE